MLKKSLVILIFALGLTVGFSARANDCPTDDGAGVGCNIGIGEYYCGGACRTGQPQCLTWTPSPICASGFACSNFATADACGYGATCAGGYTRCGAWPNYNCTATIAPVSPCSTYDTCNNYCTGCISGYSLCSATHTCVVNPGCLPGQTFNACTATCEGTVSMLKLGYDSVSGTSVIQSATYPTLFIPSSSNVGIGTSTPIAKLEIIPASGYSILAGNFKMGNIALPTADSDAASKGYVDSVISSATSSIESFWGGTLGGNIWNLNSGNVGIGTTSPVAKLSVYSSTGGASSGILVKADGGYASMDYKVTGSGAGLQTGLYQSGESFFYNSDGGMTFYTDPTLGGAGATARMSILGSGNIGIGTTAPGAKLEVYGASPILKINNTLNSTYAILELTVPGGDAQLFKTGSTYTTLKTIKALDLGFYNATAGNISILNNNPTGSISLTAGGSSTEDLTIASTGNVGIGTSDPLARLEVVPASGYSILAGNFKIGNVALPTADADAATKGYVDSTIASATSSITLWGGTTGGNIWSLNSGNVGIGLTNPTATLHVNGSIFVPNQTGIMKFGNYGTISETAGGWAYITGNNVKASLSANNSIEKSNNNTDPGQFIRMRYDSGISFHTNIMSPMGVSVADNINTRMLIDLSGNVGIGTTSPTSLVHIYGGAGTLFKITNSANADAFSINGNNLKASFYGGGGLDYPAVTFINSTSAGVGAFSGDLSLISSSLARLVVKAGGNVGIGTTTPLARLEVIPASGYSILAGNYKIGNVALPTADADAATKGYVDSTVASATSSITTLWGGTTGGNIWNLNSGNIGINTSSPAVKLHVVSPNYNIARFEKTGGGIFELGWDSATGGYIQTLSSGKGVWMFGSDASKSFGITSTGNVGIGTTTPASLLHGYSSSAVDSMMTFEATAANAGFIAKANTDIKTGSFYIWNGATKLGGIVNERTAGDVLGGVRNDLGFVNYINGNDIIFRTTGPSLATRLIIKSGGNVGIGTTTPLARLEVVPASGYSILAGNYKVGNVALPTADADAATKGYVDSTVASATSTISTIAVFVGVTTPTFSGNNNGNNGYAYAHAQCASAYAGSHVCAAFEILNTIKNGGSAPSQDAWIFNGPPAYTALANDCDARTSATSAAYGTYWQKPATGYPEGRGLLMLCNNVLRFACCQ